jgi:hypothetical protein
MTKHTLFLIVDSSSIGTIAPNWSGTSHYRRLTITLRHTTLDKTLLDE